MDETDWGVVCSLPYLAVERLELCPWLVVIL
jgi:hypothetical protein